MDVNSATRTLSPAAPRGDGIRSYLLVFADGSSSMFHLPQTGVVLIGRVPEADLRLQDASVSRRHAKITIADGEIRVVDLDSHNGIRINGEKVEGGRVVSSGDVVSIGDVIMVLHTGARSPAGRGFVPQMLLQQRLEEEIERSLQYERPLTLLVLLLDDAPADRPQVERAVAEKLRLIDVAGWHGDRQLFVLLPEVPGNLGEQRGRDLLSTLSTLEIVLRAGFATCPSDGCDADTLVQAARAAAEAAPSGSVGAAEQAALRLQLDGRNIVLCDPAMIRLYELIKRLARSDLPVLINGETGAGKENAAFCVHHYSPRSQKPFVALNCAALHESLLESELFGFERGAFSGATHSKPGLLETACGGTIFLDEVGELTASAQSKLLRAVEQRRITRLGDVREREIDIRVVAATNRNLEVEVKEKRFRQDLYFRLSAATVILPPLRERPREVVLLSQTFLLDACARAGRPQMAISPLAMHKMATYGWPGNVRELKNLMDYAAAAIPDTGAGVVLDLLDLPERISGVKGAVPRPPDVPDEGPAPKPPSTFRPIAGEIRELERRRMQEALQAARGVRKHAAELISMPLRTFVLKLKQYQLASRGEQAEL